MSNGNIIKKVRKINASISLLEQQVRDLERRRLELLRQIPVGASVKVKVFNSALLPESTYEAIIKEIRGPDNIVVMSLEDLSLTKDVRHTRKSELYTVKFYQLKLND